MTAMAQQTSPTPDDLGLNDWALIDLLSSSTFGPDATVKLPCGLTVTGDQMAALIRVRGVTTVAEPEDEVQWPAGFGPDSVKHDPMTWPAELPRWLQLGIWMVVTTGLAVGWIVAVFALISWSGILK